MEQKKPLLHLLALVFCLSFLLSSAAVPLPRTLALRSQKTPLLRPADQVITREARIMEEVFGRMDIERNDYPGSGANNRHDPKTPGRP